MSFYFSAAFLVLVIVVGLTLRRLMALNRRPLVYGFLWVFAVVVGLVFSWMPARLTPHPSLQLFPLFLAHQVFGLHDMSFRLPGLLCMASLIFVTYLLILRKHPSAQEY